MPYQLAYKGYLAYSATRSVASFLYGQHKKQKSRKMPYLRGSKTTSKYSAPTVQNQIAALNRKINRQRPAKCYFRALLQPAASAGVGFNEVTVSSSIIADGEYRNNVTGDVYINKWIKLNGISDLSTEVLRVVVYRPLKTGNSYTGPVTQGDLVRLLDPAAFHVYHDSFVNKTSETNDHGYKRFINLGNLRTVYNGSASSLESGDLRVMWMWKKTNSAVPHDTSLQICYTDK